MRDLFDTKDGALAAIYDAFLRRVPGLFAEVGDIELGAPNFAEWIEALRSIQWWELNQAHGDWVSRNLETFGPEIRGRLEKIPSVSRAEMEEKRLVRKQLAGRLEEIISPGTFAILPTAPDIAPLRGRLVDEARESRLNTMRHTCIASIAGLPQVSMPLLEKDGCPLGISLLGARGRDEQLIAAARLFKV